MENQEIYWLTLTVLMTALFWVPYIVNRLIELGPITALMYRDVDPKPKAQWAFRMEHAHKNAVENLVVFAPLILAVYVTGQTNDTTALVAMIYFFARMAHFIVYVSGLPFLRTITFFTGFICQMILGLTLLGAV